MGASAAARRWVHRHRDRWKGRPQLHADLGPDEQGRPRDTLSVIEEWFGAFRVPQEDRCGDLNARSALLRSWTGDGPVVVVLDHVVSVAQVAPLLPGSDQSVVLLTSHSELPAMRARLEAEVLRMRPLALEHREELLTRLGGAAVTAEQRRSIALASGGRPLALRLSAELLARGEPLPKETSLPEERQPAVLEEDALPLPEVIEATCRRLPERDAHAYRLLGLHPTRYIPYDAARALLGDPDQSGDVLQRLVGVGLLEAAGGDAYEFHRHIHEHARARGLHQEPPEERESALDGLVAHCTGLAERTEAALSGRWRHDIAGTYAAYGKPVADPGPVIETMRRSRAALLATVRLAADTGRYTEAYRMCQGLWTYCLKTGSHTDWVAALETGRQVAVEIPGPLPAMRMEFESGFAFLQRWFVEEGDPQRAREHFDEALEIARTGGGGRPEGHRRTESSALEGLGLLELKLRQPSRAIGLLGQALAALDGVDHPRGGPCSSFTWGVRTPRWATTRRPSGNCSTRAACSRSWAIPSTRPNASPGWPRTMRRPGGSPGPCRGRARPSRSCRRSWRISGRRSIC
jgi:hypothetical protein